MAPLASLSLALLAALPLVSAASKITASFQRRASVGSEQPSLGFSIGSKSYYVPLFTGYELSISSGPFGTFDPYFPVTVVDVTGAATCSAVEALIDEYLANDDVYDATFASGIYLQSASSISTGDFSCLQSKYGTSFIFSSGAYLEGLRSTANVATLSGSTVPAGPYIMSIDGGTATLAKVYLLYRDVQQAFTTPLIPSADGQSFFVASAELPGFETLAIPVPSRVYYLNKTTSARPLEGLRIGVKDIYDVAGIKTGCGNRAFWELYPPRANNSFPVQKLIDLGAIIVGKTKTSQFANGETATADWVDQISPFNPRGDGYQDPSSSSSGSGASMGAYSWLDHAIGSDTGGSIRNPAGVQGLYGIRPTLNAIPLTGVMPLAHSMDTAGFFARDAYSFSKFGKSWYGDNPSFQSYPSLPKNLLIPADYWPSSAVAQPIFAAFISKLEAFLGASTSNTTLDQVWNATALPVVNKTLSLYLNTTYPTIIGYDQYTNWTLPFYSDYKSANPNQGLPFADPVPITRWGWAFSQGGDAYDAELSKQSYFTSWVASNLLKHDNDTCSNTLLLYPQSAARTTYRNAYRSAPGIPTGFSNGRISNLAGIPEIVVPIGQAPYNSTISGVQDFLPVTMSIVAAKGCDYMLFDLTTKLQDAGIIGSVNTGRYSFPLSS